MKLAFLTFLTLLSWTSLSFAGQNFVCKNADFSDLTMALNIDADIAKIKVVKPSAAADLSGPQAGETALLSIDQEVSQADWMIYRFEAHREPRSYEFSVLKQDLLQKSFRLALRASGSQFKNIYTAYDMTCVLGAR